MNELIKLLIALLGGMSITVVVIVILLLNPEKIEKWSALVWRMLNNLGTLVKSAHKKYVKHDLQGRVNDYAKGLSEDAPFLASTRVNVEWTTGDVTKESFLEDGEVILRLRRDDPEEFNFVHGAYMFVSTSLLHKTKRYLSPSQREAVDLYVATRLFEKEKPSVVSRFLDEYFHKQMADTESKVAQYFDKFAQIDTGGLFYPIYLQELDFLGDKVFGKRRDDQIIIEVNSLTDFLGSVATRQIGQEGDLEFEREYCRFAIVIVGKSFKMSPSGDVYVDFIRKQLIPKKIETIYVLGLWENRQVLDNICGQLSETYEKCRTKQSKVVLRYDDRRVERKQYLIVMRMQGISVYRPSDSTV